MLKKLMITTAASAFMVGAAAAQGAPPAQSPGATPPAAKQDAPAAAPKSTEMPKSNEAPKPGAAEAPKPGAADRSAAAEAPKFIAAQKPDQYLASNFRGTNVVGDDDEKIGSVSDILFEKDGKIEAYVVSVGGFLGIGAKSVALAPNSFQIVPGDKSKNESDKLKLSMNKEQLEKAASFEAYKPPQPVTTGAGGTSPRPGGAPTGMR